MPLDRNDPASPAIDVAFTFVPRRDLSRPATGTIMANPGGPTEAISAVPELQHTLAPALRRQNLLVVDPRGFGRSSPVACPGLDLESDRSIAACANRLGRRAWSLTAGQVAADWESVRAALGVPRLTLYGNSYGTVFATAYASRYPHRVAAGYLESVVGIGRDGYAAEPRGGPIGEGVRALGRLCASAGRCRHVNPDPVRQLTRVVAAVRRGAVPGVRPIDLLTLTTGSGNDPVVTRELNAALGAVTRGDLRPLRRLIRMTQGPTGAGDRSPSSRGAGTPADDAALLAYVCTEWRYPYARSANPAQRRQQLAEYRHTQRPYAPFVQTDLPPPERREFADWCTGWPTPRTARVVEAGARFPEAPVLVVAGQLDAGTPPSGAARVAARFPRARLVITRHGDHADGLLGYAGRAPVPARCVSDRMRWFLASPTLRVRPSRCSDETMRALGAFAHSSVDLGPARTRSGLRAGDRRLVAAAFATVDDVLARRAPHPAPLAAALRAEPGLRSGTVRFDDRRGHIVLRRVRFVADVEVSGDVRLGAMTSDGRGRPVLARLRVTGPDGRRHHLVLRWRAHRPRDQTPVRLVLDGRRAAAILPGH